MLTDIRNAFVEDRLPICMTLLESLRSASVRDLCADTSFSPQIAESLRFQCLTMSCTVKLRELLPDTKYCLLADESIATRVEVEAFGEFREQFSRGLEDAGFGIRQVRR